MQQSALTRVREITRAEAQADRDPKTLAAAKAYALTLAPGAAPRIEAAQSVEQVALALHPDDLAGARFDHWRSARLLAA